MPRSGADARAETPAWRWLGRTIGAEDLQVDDQRLEEASARLTQMAASLPDTISAGALGVLDKAPFIALTVRESLIWRTEEVGRGARDMLARGDVASAILLTRAVVESAALVWRLRDLIHGRATHSASALHELLLQMLHGSKVEPSWPTPVSILTHIKHLDRHVPGVAAGYDELSEYAHPNWSGVAGLFSQIDRIAFTTRFGRNLREANPGRKTAALILIASLGLFEHAYNEISDLMPVWLAELEPL